MSVSRSEKARDLIAHGMARGGLGDIDRFTGEVGCLEHTFISLGRIGKIIILILHDHPDRFPAEGTAFLRAVDRPVRFDRMAQRITANNEEISSELKNRLNEISTQISSGMQVDLTEVTDGMRSDMNELSTEMRNNIAEIKETVQTTLVDQTADMKSTIDGMSATLNDGFEGVKNDLGEKVHSENVKVYRNIQDLLKEMDTTEDQREMLETQIGKLKSQNFILTVLSAINFGMLVIVILFQMGIL